MTTATLFNYSYSPPSSLLSGPAPANLRRIVILGGGPPPDNLRRIVITGGGTAGWMTALVLARSFISRGVGITVLESPAIPIIGVGEGSTPWLRGFFDMLGI